MCMCVCMIATVAVKGCHMHMSVTATIALKRLDSKRIALKLRLNSYWAAVGYAGCTQAVVRVVATSRKKTRTETPELKSLYKSNLYRDYISVKYDAAPQAAYTMQTKKHENGHDYC